MAGGVTLRSTCGRCPTRAYPHFGGKSAAQVRCGVGNRYSMMSAALGASAARRAATTTRCGCCRVPDALGRLIERDRGTTLCLIGAPKEPLDCHRTVLVSRLLAEPAFRSNHLLADGGTARIAMIPRKRCSAKMPDPICFYDRARLARACAARERAISEAELSQGTSERHPFARHFPLSLACLF